MEVIIVYKIYYYIYNIILYLFTVSHLLLYSQIITLSVESLALNESPMRILARRAARNSSHPDARR